jgi:sugar O-acyltransferase (sialic acid O-acetyltransferase NeuD family)
MTKNILIYGAGGFGREVAWLIERINKVKYEWNILGFIDDVKTEMYGEFISNIKLLGGSELFAKHKNEVFVTCAVGSSAGRRSMYQRLGQYPNVKLATLVDPSVVVGSSSVIGDGSIICYGARVTVNATIGTGVVVNVGSTIGHNSNIGDYSSLFVNVIVSGTVSIGENCEIGSGAFIREYLAICSNVVIAPLSSVLRDVTDSGVYAGNPARRIQ